MDLPESLWKKYLEGNVTPEEKAEVEGWLLSPGAGQGMPDAMAARIRARLEARSGRPVIVRWIIATAAAAAAVLAAVVLWHTPAKPTPEISWRTVTNTGRSPQLVTLPDKTQIWLQGKATLQLDSRGRHVRLKGEAFFEVRHAAAEPFVVEAGGLTTTVLGTVFDVSDDPVSVSLVRGKVKVDRGVQEVLLAPGQMLTDSFKVEKITVPDVGAWTSGNLVLNQLPLDKALDRLSDYYGITIHKEEALMRGRTVTATYMPTESWQQVLEHLLFIYQLTYTEAPDHSVRIVKKH